MNTAKQTILRGAR